MKMKSDNTSQILKFCKIMKLSLLNVSLKCDIPKLPNAIQFNKHNKHNMCVCYFLIMRTIYTTTMELNSIGTGQ